jgi:uncharacterized LabA/DUF88 family protein
MSLETACIFVDGENLRHSLVELFDQEFNPSDYLPRNADWSGFFDHLVGLSCAKSRLRAYWYVVESIDFWPYNLTRLKIQDPITLQKVLQKDQRCRLELSQLTDPAQREILARQKADIFIERQREMKNRFDGWRTFQEGIEGRFDSVEFRRSGSIHYDLFRKTLGREKAVDVKLATDLLELRDIYDVAIILSGDQDYVPAVRAVKDSGKHLVSVSFLKRDGKVLPGGARRLSQATDCNYEIAYADVKKYMRFPQRPIAASVGQP